MRRSSRLRGKRVNYNEAAMVTAYEKRAGAELTYKEKPKLYVKKPVYRPRLPKKPRQIPRYKPPPRPRQRAVQPRQRPSTSSSQPRVRYHTPARAARAARAATPTPRARIVQDEHEIIRKKNRWFVILRITGCPGFTKCRQKNNNNPRERARSHENAGTCCL